MPFDFLDQAQADAGVKGNNRVYSPLVVLWLMAMQRLQGGASLQAAVLELLRVPSTFWPKPCKRVQQLLEDNQMPSSNTGGYNQSRLGLPESITEKSCDRIYEQLGDRVDGNASPGPCRAFLLDGSSIRMPHEPALCERYPPGSNQHGENHWPLLRVLVAHDLRTGLAMRPEWGAFHGPDAVSEQELLERSIDRLPSGSTVVGDANFGVFSVAYATAQRAHPMVLRSTMERARRLAGEGLRDGIDRTLVWKPSRSDRRNHPDLPADASVEGRLMVREVQPDNGAAPFLVALFTTLPGSQQEVFAIYGRRWAIETDLRTLKSTLHLDQLTCTTPEMVAKEIHMGIVAYNLVRAMIAFAAEQSGTPPRGFSFTKVRLIVQAFAPRLAQAPNEEAATRIFGQMMKCIQQSKLPKRKRKRPSYPRAVWKRGAAFPNRKG